MKIRKRVVGLLLAGAMLVGSTMSALAAPTAVWNVSAYQDVPSSGSCKVTAGVEGIYCTIECSVYSSDKALPVSFSSSNFKSGVSIAGVGKVYAYKLERRTNYTYTVNFSAPGKGRVLASGKVVG